MKRVYISGPLHAVPDRELLREFYEFLAQGCRDCGFTPYLPHTNTDPEKHRDLSSAEVFSRDLEALRNADAIVAYIGLPSSGVGAELGLAFEYDIRVIALYKHDEAPSRFLLGMLDAADTAVALSYRDQHHCTQLLQEQLIGSVDKLSGHRVDTTKPSASSM